jgi:hypothetical protein
LSYLGSSFLPSPSLSFSTVLLTSFTAFSTALRPFASTIKTPPVSLRRMEREQPVVEVMKPTAGWDGRKS